jgi:integrase
MARRIRSASLENRTTRLKLEVRRRPYTVSVARGIRLAYRRNQGGGTWSVIKSVGVDGVWLQKFAIADDHEEANGVTVMSFWEASEAARKIARGDGSNGEIDAGRPATVSEAVAAYARDLQAREAAESNAGWLPRHLPQLMMSKPVSLLTAREIRSIRDGLLEKGLKRNSVNRFMRSLAACLNLAARDDERITNSRVWKIPGLRDAVTSRNVVLAEDQIRDLVASSYATGGDRFGAFVETLASTGVRPIQVRRLKVGDLEADHPDGPRLHMPSSRKGSGTKRIDRTTLPITLTLAQRLKVEGAGRADEEPLLLLGDGVRFRHEYPFAIAAAAAGLPKNVTLYALRHSFITRSLLRGVPTRLVAAAVDTSTAMLEMTYSKHITSPGADLMRAALIDFGAPAPDDANVVALRGKGR